MAVAIRNRWRRQQLAGEMRAEVAPKNIMMIGPTGVGKTEIARRLAKLTGAPFIKVEATKYTEVGYYGRDVESMVRELVENAIGLVRESERENVEAEAPRPRRGAAARPAGAGAARLRRRCPTAPMRPSATSGRARRCGRCWPPASWKSARSSCTIEQKAVPMMFTGMGMEQMDVDLQGMFEKILPKHTARREMTVAEARSVLFEQECDALINQEKVNAAGDRAGREPGHHLRRRDRQDRGQRADARGRRLAAGRAARPAADRRRHDRADPLRLRADRPHSVHRRRGVSPRQAERPDARAARPVSHPRRADRT